MLGIQIIDPNPLNQGQPTALPAGWYAQNPSPWWTYGIDAIMADAGRLQLYAPFGAAAPVPSAAIPGADTTKPLLCTFDATSQAWTCIEGHSAPPTYLVAILGAVGGVLGAGIVAYAFRRRRR